MICQTFYEKEMTWQSNLVLTVTNTIEHTFTSHESNLLFLNEYNLGCSLKGLRYFILAIIWILMNTIGQMPMGLEPKWNC